LLIVERRQILAENGLFYLGGLLFCADRFVVEFFRDNAAAAGMTLAQWACCVGAGIFAWKLAKLMAPREMKSQIIAACR